MIERSKNRSNRSKRTRAERVNKKRRLMMEGLESRQLLAVFTDLPTAAAPTNLPVYDINRNVGAVQAFSYVESERANESGLNDTQFNADFVPLGTGPGQQDTVDIFGALPVNLGSSIGGFRSDIDTFSFDLRGGDILDIATLGAAGDFTVRNSNGLILFGAPADIDGDGLPDGNTNFFNIEPRQTLGNLTGTMVIPRDGRYSITVSPFFTTGNYTLGLRVYRPVTESLSVGDAQILYLDFDGDIVDANLITDNQGLPVSGVVRIPSLAESLNILGLPIGDTVTTDRLIEDIVDNTIRIFEDITRTGSNGDYEATSNPGEYGIRILNSRDHKNQISFADPRVTRMLIGGSSEDILNDGVYAFAENVDIGNFDMNQLAFFALDAFAATPVALAPNVSLVDFWGKFLGSVVAHEAGHTFGLAHTENLNNIGTLADAGGSQLALDYFQGIGPDFIFGTLDDIDPVYEDDFYINNRPLAQVSPGEFPYYGFNEVTDNFSHVLSTGTFGGNVTGRVFDDLNRNGSGTNDPGLPGVEVFADLNRNGFFDAGEPIDFTDNSGHFGLNVGPGQVDVIALTPPGFVATTATRATVRATAGGSTGGISFGFYQIDPDVTGKAYVDSNGNGNPDPGEVGLEGVYVYIDLDGDDRPDLGEPGENTDENGNYVLRFPGPGFYTIRTDLAPGFERTEPASGEYEVFYNGTSLDGNYDFGFLPSQDFGDLPLPYPTTVAANGASHGLLPGLTIGANIDREGDGFPTSAANGDDLDNVDDEDGVRLISPLAPPQPGEAAVPGVFEVTVTNTTSSAAYLQGFMDFNRDGDFEDVVNGVSEHFAVDVAVATGTIGGTIQLPVTVPAGVDPGTAYQRFRISQTRGLGSDGFAKSGEVEDYAFPVSFSSDVTNPDPTDVPRNSLSFPIKVLDNDFNIPENPLTIFSVDDAGTRGTIVPGFYTDPITGVRSEVVFYTPPNGYIGPDSFTYRVRDSFGKISPPLDQPGELVSINVLFKSEKPIAVDDVFEVPQGSSNRALNVLDNDVASVNGGLTITSVTTGSNGGSLTIVGGGQSIRYTPRAGFDGTEQFTYTIQDQAGQVSSATGTINLLPGSRNDDVLDFQIEILDETNNMPITNIPAGEAFLVRVSVEDLRNRENLDEGVFSAFLDLLYTDELVTPDIVPGTNSPNIVYGSKFGPLQSPSIDTPGLVDEVGGLQSVTNIQPHDTDFDGNIIPDTLFTLRMIAGAPGVALFQVDPADEPTSESTVLGTNPPNPESDRALTVSELRLGTAELIVLPGNQSYPSAIDDSFPEGRDSNNDPIPAVSPAVLRVLDNDNVGPLDTVLEVGLQQSATKGVVTLNTNGTPDFAGDDFFNYQAFPNPDGLDSFTYFIVTENANGVVSVSSAEVTIALGNQNEDAIVAYDFGDQLVAGDLSGAPIDQSSLGIGDRFGIEIYVEDLRNNPTYVFAGYLDMLYDTGIIAPSAPFSTPNGETEPGFDFAVDFGPDYQGDAGVGTAARPGIIDEFGTLVTGTSTPSNPALLATVFFDVIGTGTANVVGSPADVSPFQDTLLFREDDPIDRSRLRFETLPITIGGAGFGAPAQNPFLAQDVNNDGAVSPVDALVIINEMSRSGSSGEGEAAAAASVLASPYFTDVNGDRETSALDALQVINYLARMNGAQRSGEQVVLPSESESESSSTTETADDVFAALGGNVTEKVVSADVPGDATAAQVSMTPSTPADDDDEDDVLSLLADDVSGLWG